MNLLRRFRRFFVSLEKAFLILFLCTMVALSFLQVILRQFFSSGILWADIFLRHLVLWVAFFGAALATDQDKHFAVDIVKKALPEKAQRFSKILTDLFALVCLFFLSDSAVRFAQDEYGSGSVLFTIGRTEMPAFWMDIIIPIGFILLLAHFLFQTAEDIFALKREPSARTAALSETSPPPGEKR